MANSIKQQNSVGRKSKERLFIHYYNYYNMNIQAIITFPDMAVPGTVVLVHISSVNIAYHNTECRVHRKNTPSILFLAFFMSACRRSCRCCSWCWWRWRHHFQRLIALRILQQRSGSSNFFFLEEFLTDELLPIGLPDMLKSHAFKFYAFTAEEGRESVLYFKRNDMINDLIPSMIYDVIWYDIQHDATSIYVITYHIIMIYHYSLCRHLRTSNLHGERAEEGGGSRSLSY